MDSPLVLTKIRMPRLRPRTINRPRLDHCLDPEPGTRLVLVSAPAGYGKTTLLTDWSHTLSERGTRVAWYALDQGDDDPLPFGSYLLASLSEALGPGAGLSSAVKLLRASPQIGLQKILPSIINALETSDYSTCLVLDDYHLISSPSIHSAVAYLVDHLPETARMVIGSRSDPPLPLARLRARGHLSEIRAADLRFTADETAEFLNVVMRLGLAQEVMATLEARTEGWVAGLQLAALSLSGRPDPASLISSLQGSNRYLVNYMLQEVVNRQPAEVQTFLLRTSVLERMCGPLCDSILDDYSGSEATLERLEQANLFVIPLDDQGIWYRYHHLFRAFLRTRLAKMEPQREAALHRSASEWYAAHGLLREAVMHALRAQDWNFAADVVERHGMATLMHSEISTVYEWCGAFPEEVLRTRPMLCVLLGWTLVLGYRSSSNGRVEELLQMAESYAAPLEDKVHARWLAGQAAVVRTFIGNAPNPNADPWEQLRLTQRALDLLPPADPLRSTTTLIIGYAHMALHGADAGNVVMEQAKQLSLMGQNYYGVVEATFTQAQIACKQGQLRRSIEICRQGRAAISDVVRDPDRELPAVGSLDLVQGCVFLEYNQLAEAERDLLRGLDLIGWTFNPYYQMTACIALFRLREIQGRSAEALQFLDRLDEAWPDIRFCTEALRVMHSLRISAQDPETKATASARCHEFFTSLGDEAHLPGIGPSGGAEAYYLARLAWARAQIALGKPEVALVYLEKQREIAEAHGLGHRLIELGLAKALALEAQDARMEALEELARVLAIAEPEGYIRSFDQGAALQTLLEQAAQQGIARGYAARILAAVSPTPFESADQPKSAGQLMISAPAAPPDDSKSAEHLSERELEVLRLMARGASNQEIAEQLVVTVGTVKSHINHILEKLDTHNRNAAVARARELRLLEI